MVDIVTSVLGSPQADAAAIAGIVSLIVAVVTVFLADRRGKLDERLAELKGQFDRELAEQRARLDDRASYAAERVAHALLMQPAWTQRSFAAIQAKLGGFTADELRKVLVQAGAVRFKGHDGTELWGLLDKNHGALG